MSAGDAGRDTPKVEVNSIEDISNLGGTGHTLSVEEPYQPYHSEISKNAKKYKFIEKVN